jgi:hypothetical protein
MSPRALASEKTQAGRQTKGALNLFAGLRYAAFSPDAYLNAPVFSLAILCLRYMVAERSAGRKIWEMIDLACFSQIRTFSASCIQI